MAIQNTTNLSNAVTTRYTSKYQGGAAVKRLYDQLAMPVSAPKFELESRRGMGSSYTFNFVSEMTPGSTTISEVVDIDPQILRDATSTISPTSRGEALQWSRLVNLEAYTDYRAKRAEILGMNAMETIDNLAKAAALQGTLRVASAARASLDAGTAADLWSSDAILSASALVQTLRCPPFMENGRPQYLAIAHPDIYFDLLTSGDVNSVALYQDKEILFNYELGSIGNFKLIISAWAKVFGAAGADNGSNAATTLNDAAANALDTTVTVASATNISAGRYLTIGTEETGSTHYDDNELVKWASGTTTITFTGAGANGGLRFDHADGAAVRNADNVYPVAYGSPMSLVKIFAQEVGPFGEFVGPKKSGLAEQFESMAWSYYGNYGRIAENTILRGEYASATQA
jgi:N4-gp56 family major capsid protein